MKRLITGAIAIATLVLPSTANAATACSGFLTNVISYANGDVTIYGLWRTDWTQICNLNQERLGVSPQTCFSWFSIMSSSITENKQVVVYYPTLTQDQCATMPTYASSPVPGYVRLVKGASSQKL